VDRLGWAVTTAVRVDGHHVGIRSPSREVDGAVRALLAAHVVDDEGVPPNFSLAFTREERSAGSTKKLHVLYKGHSSAARSRGGTKLAMALLFQLGALAPSPPPNGKLRIGTFALVGHGEAVLLPPRYVRSLEQLEPKLARHGIRVAHGTVHTLDAEQVALVVESGLDYDPAALAQFEGLYPTPRTERAPVEPGRYPLRAWALDGTLGTDPTSRAAAVSSATRHVRGLADSHAVSVLDALIRIIGQVTTFVPAGDMQELEAQVRSVLAK